MTEAGHAVPLAVKFDAVVDGTNGNVALPSIAAGFLHTRLEGHGGFETPDGSKGKQFKLDAAIRTAVSTRSSGCRCTTRSRLSVEPSVSSRGCSSLPAMATWWTVYASMRTSAWIPYARESSA